LGGGLPGVLRNRGFGLGRFAGLVVVIDFAGPCGLGRFACAVGEIVALELDRFAGAPLLPRGPAADVASGADPT
jgi:hypothetical protein